MRRCVNFWPVPSILGHTIILTPLPCFYIFLSAAATHSTYTHTHTEIYLYYFSLSSSVLKMTFFFSKWGDRRRETELFLSPFCRFWRPSFCLFGVCVCEWVLTENIDSMIYFYILHTSIEILNTKLCVYF